MLRLSCSLNLPGALAPPLCSVATHSLSAFPIFNCTSSCNRYSSDATEGASFSLSALRERKKDSLRVDQQCLKKIFSSGMHFLFAHSDRQLRPRMCDRSMSNKILQRRYNIFCTCARSRVRGRSASSRSLHARVRARSVRKNFLSLQSENISVAVEKYSCSQKKIFYTIKKYISDRVE